MIIQRINLGLYAIFGQLHATGELAAHLRGALAVRRRAALHRARSAGGRLDRRPPRMIEVIALDGDDTLWHSEQLFVDTQVGFRELLAPYVDLDDDALDARLVEVERRNLPTFGYGVKAFTLSLVETAIEVTDGAIPSRARCRSILDLGKVLLDHPVQLLDGVPRRSTPSPTATG